MNWDDEPTDEEYDTGDSVGLTEHEQGREAVEAFYYNLAGVCRCKDKGLRAHLRVDHDALVSLYGRSK